VNIYLKRGLAAFLFLFIGFHTIAIADYNLPTNLMEQSMKGVVDAYVLPFFGQNWSLFAPNPGGYIASFRFRYRYGFADGSKVVTPFLDGADIFPAKFSGPLHPMSLIREISYSCSNLAENEAAKKRRPHPGDPDPATITAPAAAIDASTECSARVALSLAHRLKPALASARAGDPVETSVQIAYTLAAAPRVTEHFKAGAASRPLHYDIVHVTPWLTSPRVEDVPSGVEIAQ
jgi:Family of unknown function (DUF5819)